MRKRTKRKLKNEINVVPYIDVMLVLLIIFMVTAPLLNLGVEIELPESNARPVETQKDPVIVEVTSDGRFFLTLQGAAAEEIDAESLVAKVSAFVRNNPEVQVMVAGDRRTDYGTVYQGMVLLQQAGVSKVGLMSKPEAN
ncbi:MAG: protein TolR [Xanthomonadales bacterium]|jgi:biopolymer transport protein TolR|uniref:Tol-Pal system protein TolR n=1 Tax=Aquimonas voraii TaxID=265719 RepID=A0A1G6ZB44_9GAMM|nr:protein TolR [Aquimonas voraii]MCU0757353.1 protein TolR [Xanthomonadales bacterium]SDD99523.1 Cell division and transport-associated protein TolR [Aquimonas voraii]